MDLDSGVRKKRTLAERRESDKLRQRRFRAKKREEARLLQAITGVVDVKKKDRVNVVPKKTAEEIRETNRIRQQRFRARRRDEGSVMNSILGMDVKMESVEEPSTPTQATQLPTADPVDFVQRFLLQAANEEKSRQTEIRREKDRIRKRRERQRKKDNAMKQAGFTNEHILKHRQLEKEGQGTSQEELEVKKEIEEEKIEEEEPNHEDMEYDPEDAYIPEGEEEVDDDGTPESEYFDAQHFMEQLEKMGLVLGVADDKEGSLEIKQKTPVSDESTSSTPDLVPNPSVLEMFTIEKKPWQRCNTAEERRERERMRKRMYRAKQKYISTGKLEMQWDPSPIKRSPNDDPDDGITPIPEWNTSLSPEQKMMAHRIYNKRYRERLKCSALREEASRSQSRESSDKPIEESVECS